MLQCFFVRTSFFGGELAGAFVELRGHLGGFFRRTTERDEDFGQFRNFHGKNNLIRKARTQETEPKLFLIPCVPCSILFYFTESRGTRVMLMMPMRLSGRSCGCVGVVPIFSSTSSPLINLPNVVY